MLNEDLLRKLESCVGMRTEESRMQSRDGVKYAKPKKTAPAALMQTSYANGALIEDYIQKKKSGDSFSAKLLKYIDESKLSDADVYKAAGIDRRHFSKIRSGSAFGYHPKKMTVIALCLALRLDAEKTEELLALAGHSFSTSETTDLVVMFCIENGVYDISEVNEALARFGEKTIGTLE